MRSGNEERVALWQSAPLAICLSFKFLPRQSITGGLTLQLTSCKASKWLNQYSSPDWSSCRWISHLGLVRAVRSGIRIGGDGYQGLIQHINSYLSGQQRGIHQFIDRISVSADIGLAGRYWHIRNWQKTKWRRTTTTKKTQISAQNHCIPLNRHCRVFPSL